MNEQEMWEAVQNSDADYDGMFFYAVKTTGIFCRPSCRSKIPNKENICYFYSADEARKAGFRPCKRCRSDLLEYQPMREIAEEIKQKLYSAIEESNQFTLENMGLTTRRLTDIFKQEYGITPKEYRDSMRLREAEKMLVQTDKKIIDVAYEVGFSNVSSFNRFFKTHIGKTPSEYRKEENSMIYVDTYKSKLGNILLAADETGIIGIWFEGQKYYASTLPDEYFLQETIILKETKKWLDIYFKGEEPEFIPPLHLIGTTFQQKVWKILLEIPYGKTVTYGEIARQMAVIQKKNHLSARSIGGAVAHNPISIIIPCHRVIGAKGKLTGYAGGIEKKVALLKLEHTDMKNS